MFETHARLTSDGKSVRDLKRKVDLDRRIHLERDLLLPCPWKRSRLIDFFATIGKGRLNGAWEQDCDNHFVELWLPMGIAWVHGGNHSIATGIVQVEGEIISDSVYDISEVYKYVYTDGEYYISKEDNGIVSDVPNVEFCRNF